MLPENTDFPPLSSGDRFRHGSQVASWMSTLQMSVLVAWILSLILCSSRILNDNQLIVNFRCDSNTKSVNFLFSNCIAEILQKSSHSFVIASFHSSLKAPCVEAPTCEIVDSHGRLKTCFLDFPKNLN